MGFDGRTLRKLRKYERLFRDDRYMRCLELASGCKTPQRFGALLVTDTHQADEAIIGEGRNRWIAKPAFLERIVRQGYGNHAEIEALNETLMREAEGFDEDEYAAAYIQQLPPERFSSARGSEIYVAGYYGSGHLDIRDGPLFTCTICGPKLRAYGVAAINTPTPEGWVRFTVDEGIEFGKAFRKEGERCMLHKRQRAGKRNVTLDELRWFRQTHI